MQSPKAPANGFVAVSRRIYNPLGFTKGYNFVLFFIFAGAFMGFTLARLQYLDFDGVYCNPNNNGMNGAAPGECYYYTKGHYEIGIRLHLYTILPAAFLAVFQFVPAIRHKIILFHRINGYVIIILSLFGIVGALMIARIAFGGGLDTQAAVGFLSILTVGSLAISYYNIKRLQIDQHRAWMLRAWFYFGTIITVRLIMIITALIVTKSGNYYMAQPCAKIAYIYANNASKTLQLYPECESYFEGSNHNQNVVVNLNFNGRSEQITASLGSGFGMALWLALGIHAIGVEVYLALTPRESERLRKVSYERQVEAGFSKPGSAGLTVDRLGDTE